MIMFVGSWARATHVMKYAGNVMHAVAILMHAALLQQGGRSVSGRRVLIPGRMDATLT